VSTLAGTGEIGYVNAAVGILGRFNRPYGVAVDEDGNVIVADMDNDRIRKITPHGQVSILAATGQRGYRDGEETVAQFNQPGEL
jgi:DNA-binding beta-propeller fold protein YncE